ncbi:hypothetical protein FN846DRAFT_410333 [Sphaerosporella brunnea]|uniref:Uncharacterized protein n=1 Tax=Sphaerosporella brunnea TaxID=1250544 RepID=A0A5J5EFM7_9PEZI|nr:hypothetical protein FN846DRAFT_410333 [Sphaerosporella brunnea]
MQALASRTERRRAGRLISIPVFHVRFSFFVLGWTVQIRSGGRQRHCTTCRVPRAARKRIFTSAVIAAMMMMMMRRVFRSPHRHRACFATQ